MSGLKPTAYAAFTLAFASLGDAFLYPFLPLNYHSVGVSVLWVGVLLSINRFVRILANGMVVKLFATVGLRKSLIAAAVIAVASTTGYAFASGVISWIVLRICWGLAFAVMRLGSLGYALHQPKPGIATGMSRSIQEVGPFLTLLLAPFVLSYFKDSTIFLFFSVLSLPAIYFAWNLPDTTKEISVVSTTYTLKFPSTHNCITLVSSIIMDGIVVIVLGQLFLKFNDADNSAVATALTAFYLGYRRFCLVAFSLTAGQLADKYGTNLIFVISISFVIPGLLLLLSGWVTIGIILVFTFYSIHSAITPGAVSRESPYPLQDAAENATWRDIGAAIGTFFGGILITSPYLIHTLLFATFILLILIFIHSKAPQKVKNYLYLWK